MTAPIIGYEPGSGNPIYARPKLTPLDFQWRYTFAEQRAIERAIEEHEDPDVRADLKILDKSLQKASYVDVTDPRTIAGVQYHAAVGLIAPARVAEILAPPT